LNGLTEQEVDELKMHLVHRTYFAGETIIKKDTIAEHIFFIESGRVSIHDTIDGTRDIMLALISSGNSFGEMALLDKQSRSADVKAHTDTSCFVMLYEKLDRVESLAGIKVKILTNLGASLSSRLRRANKEIASFT
jgi:CRP-like cAMP-binding protein